MNMNRCKCGDLLSQHYVKDLRCANPKCDCQGYATLTCPQCHGPAANCGYDSDNDVCPEYERALSDEVSATTDGDLP